MSITRLQSAGSVSAIRAKCTMPALLTSTDTGPKAFSAAGHRGGPVRFARDVEAREDGAVTEFIDQALSLLIDDVRDHDIRALGDEAARVASAHSTGATRDDHGPILEAFHSRSPAGRIVGIAASERPPLAGSFAIQDSITKSA